MEKTSTSLLLLPDEIVYDILARLPAKSLQRFKLVSMPWGSLISDPNFAESHLHRANTSHDKKLLRVGWLDLKMGSHPYFSFYSMDSDGSNPDVVTLDCDGSNRDVVTLDHSLFRDYQAQILGSCNGLLFVAVDYEDYFLWNPSTGKYKRIPRVIVTEQANFISGLGYEFTSRNYKAIIVSHVVSGPSSPHVSYDNYESINFRVYNYRRNSWTMKGCGEFPYCLHDRSSAVMVKGVPHWCVYHRESDESRNHSRFVSYFRVTYVIIYIDLKNEKFKEVELPEWATDEMKFYLGVLGGCLSISLDPQESFTEVWAMKEYGIPESWTKLFVISSSYGQLRPICFARNNEEEVLMEADGRHSIIFNLKESTERILLLDGYKWFSECTHVGSLVFPEENGNQS